MGVSFGFGFVLHALVRGRRRDLVKPAKDVCKTIVRRPAKLQVPYAVTDRPIRVGEIYLRRGEFLTIFRERTRRVAGGKAGKDCLESFKLDHFVVVVGLGQVGKLPGIVVDSENLAGAV